MQEHRHPSLGGLHPVPETADQALQLQLRSGRRPGWSVDRAVHLGFRRHRRLRVHQTVGLPPEIDSIWIVALAAVIGFAGNEAVALFLIRVGKEIGSAALIADGHHARADGLSSLAVLSGAVGVWLGYHLADPIVGLVISAVILRIVVETSKSVFSRLLDGVEPEVPDEVRSVAGATDGVEGVSEVRVRWLGHKMLAEVNISVDRGLSVEAGHDIAEEVHHELLHRLKYLSNATVHVDPVGLAGEEYHRHGGAKIEHSEDHAHEPGNGHPHNWTKEVNKMRSTHAP